MTKSAARKQRLAALARAHQARRMQADAVPVPARGGRRFTPLENDDAAESSTLSESSDSSSDSSDTQSSECSESSSVEIAHWCGGDAF
jgi:hypothetical protein